MYLVYCYYDPHGEVEFSPLFVTESKITAENYKAKFEKTIEKAKKYLRKYEIYKHGDWYLDYDKYSNIYRRYNSITNMVFCDYQKIKVK